MTPRLLRGVIGAHPRNRNGGNSSAYQRILAGAPRPANLPLQPLYHERVFGVLVFLANSRYKRRLNQEVVKRWLQGRGRLLAVIIVVLVVCVALRGPQGLEALLEKRKEIRQLEEQNAAAARENERRREHIRRLEDSTSEQEMEIRKQLKLQRPGETTFILPNAPAANGGNAPEAPSETQP